MMNKERIVCEAEHWLPRMDADFERGVAILHCGSTYIDESFMRLMDVMTSNETIACTASVMDILAGQSLRYERTAGQRRFAMYFKQHPLALGSRKAWVAVVHEAGHHLEDTSPARDMVDESAAVKHWWKSPRDGSAHHGRRWVRAVAHLSYRLAVIANIAVDAELLLGQYGPATAITQSLRAEVRQVGTPIRAVLATEPSQEFTHMCDERLIA